MTTLKQLTELAEHINSLTGRKFYVRGGDTGGVVLVDEHHCDYSPRMSHKAMGQWLDAMRRGIEIANRGNVNRAEAVLNLVGCAEAVSQDWSENSTYIKVQSMRRALRQVKSEFGEL
jgi:hypothetical protein